MNYSYMILNSITYTAGHNDACSMLQSFYYPFLRLKITILSSKLMKYLFIILSNLKLNAH